MNEPNMTNIYDNLPDKSHKAREEAKAARKVEERPAPEGKRVQKVVRGKVKTRKSPGRALFNTFINEDAANIKQYITLDVLVPSIKKAIYDIIVGTLDMGLFGGRRDGKRPTADRISYNNYSSSSRRDDSYNRGGGSTFARSYDDIVLETRGEAEAVLSRMDELMEEYQIVRVGDLYDLVGITGEYTDNNYGWTNIRNAEVVRVRDGYKIKMPRALPIRK